MKKILFIGILLIIGSIGINVHGQRPTPFQSKKDSTKGYQVGDKASDFNLKGVDDKIYSLSNMGDNKGYIVIFTSNECPFAIMYQDRIIDLHYKMAPKGYPVVAINSNDASMSEGDSYEMMKVRSSEKKFPFVYLTDADQSIYPKYGATKTPHVFLLDNNLVVQYIGAIDDNPQSPEDAKMKYVESAIQSLENGTKPDPNFTKAIGCPIKSKNGRPNDGERPKKGERRGPPPPEKIMEMMDVDKDDKISKSEVQGPLKNDFDSLDQNGDGYLTTEELSKIKRK